MYLVTLIALCLTILIALRRAFQGPTVFDRVLAVNMISTITILMIATLGFHHHRPDFMDLALLYAMISFVVSIGILKFVRSGSEDISETEREFRELSN